MVKFVFQTGGGPVGVEIESQQAKTEPAEWTKLINAMIDNLSIPGPSEPDPDRWIANKLVAEFGGEIVHADLPGPFVEGRVY